MKPSDHIPNQRRKVVATDRPSIRTPFIAPELSPAPTLAVELDKGTKGWTDFDKKVPSLEGSHLCRGHLDRVVLEGITARDPEEVIRRPKSSARVRHPRPTKRRWA
ncbi:hypothetical protein SEA_SNAPE_100 [Mycobacterium phage Snape]|nr:hypothetical protein SEA_SNAPE_100 [Mycobacterium phage Snape]